MNRTRSKKAPAKIPAKNDIPPWEFVRKRIKPKFAQAGIMSCELRYKPCTCFPGCEGCTGQYNRTFAHSMLRVSIAKSGKKEYMEEVILACQHCHSLIEKLGEEKMMRVVRNVIEQRIIPVKSIFR